MANIVKNQKIGAIVAGGFAALLVVAACIGGGEKTDSPNLEHEVEVACQDAKYYSASEFYQKNVKNIVNVSNYEFGIMDDGSTDESGNKISMAYWNGKSNDGEVIRFACYVSKPDDGDISVHYISADNNDIWNTMSDLIAINAKGAMRLAVGEIDQAEISELLINERGGMVVHLNWGMKNSAETAENAIAVHCSRLKDSIESFSEISELAIFWNIPYLEDNGGKCAFERLDGSLVKSDV